MSCENSLPAEMATSNIMPHPSLSGLRIAEVRATVLSAPLSEPFGFSQWYYERKSNLLVTVTCEDGTVGHGECYGTAAPVAAAVQGYAPLLTGRDPCAQEALWQSMWKASLDYARRGTMMAAISGIDLALWDIRGKRCGLPVRALLGGVADGVECYATGMYFRRGDDERGLLARLLDEADDLAAQGFRTLKVKIGKNPAFDRDLLHAFRRRFPALGLAADANHAYSFAEARGIGRLMEELGYLWFEEPLSPEDPEGMAALRAAVAVPIAAGECEQTRFGFQRLFAARALDIAQPDLAFCGGITEGQRILALAMAQHVDVMPHAWGLRLNQAAAASMLALEIENPGRHEARRLLLEVDCTEHPVRDAIFARQHRIADGRLIFNGLPGLGLEVDLDAIARFATA